MSDISTRLSPSTAIEKFSQIRHPRPHLPGAWSVSASTSDCADGTQSVSPVDGEFVLILQYYIRPIFTDTGHTVEYVVL
jgi:hypothetical protein